MTQSQSGDVPGFASIRIGLRSPRVAIAVPDDDLWVTHAANALYSASRCWGGSGFVIAPAGPVVPDVLLRAVCAYDPDHVVGLAYTHQDLWDLGLSVPPKDADGDEYDSATLSSMAGQLGHITSSNVLARATSAYRTSRGDDHRIMTQLGPSKRPRQIRDIAEPLSLSPVDTAPTDPSGLPGLGLAMRLGFARRPQVPYETSWFRAPDGWMTGLSLRGVPTPRAPGQLGPATPLPGPDAWQLTEDGLGWIYRYVARPRKLFVIGSTLSDFCLAIMWDRMCGHSSATWVPVELYGDPEGTSDLGNALSAIAWESERVGGSILVTSCSLERREVQRVVDDALSASIRIVGGDDDEPAVAVVETHDLSFQPSHHLAYVPDGFDIRETMPTTTKRGGAVQIMAPIRARIPGARADAGASRPDWEVDVDFGALPAPRGRMLPPEALLADENDWTTVRASRAGISYQAHDMGFVAAGASLRQSIAEPELRYPGLREWIGYMAAPTHTIAPSDAGRRAEVCCRLWGGRDELLRDLPSVRPLLVEFTRKVGSDSQDFPEQDGLAISGLGPVLTIAGCARAMDTDDLSAIRQRIDGLVSRNILRRGLVLRCGQCSARSFVSIDLAKQINVCSRCAEPSELISARWGNSTEPTWYYDLHNAVRELINQNGDIPMLGAAHLLAKARHYTDESEIEFTKVEQSRPEYELDLVAISDDEVIVGEAKRNPRRTQGRAALNKLVQAAAQLRADRIVLMAGAPDLWNEAQANHLREQIEARRWADGRQPRLTVFAGLTGPDVVTTGDPWPPSPR